MLILVNLSLVMVRKLKAKKGFFSLGEDRFWSVNFAMFFFMIWSARQQLSSYFSAIKQYNKSIKLWLLRRMRSWCVDFIPIYGHMFLFSSKESWFCELCFGDVERSFRWSHDVWMYLCLLVITKFILHVWILYLKWLYFMLSMFFPQPKRYSFSFH